MTNLTQPEQRVLAVIATFRAENGYPPSIREIKHALGYRTTSGVAYHVDRLVAKGELVKTPGKSRTLRLAGDA